MDTIIKENLDTILDYLELEINQEFKIRGSAYTYRVNEKYFIEYDRPNTDPRWGQSGAELVELAYDDIAPITYR